MSFLFQISIVLKILQVIMLSLFFTVISCKNKALLFAGSNEWINYRHQADVWTVYQELLKRNFDTNDIRIACYDDIANNPLNIFKGKIFHDLDHKNNVYGGSDIINYKNKITKETFREALLDLKGTENDNLFIYYNDHGNIGFVGVPNEEEGSLTSKYLTEIFTELNQKNSYKNCIFLIEACLSGSVGEYIEKRMTQSGIKNLAIITASKANESSNGLIYDPWINTVLSNQFSSNFIDKIREEPECLISDMFDYIVSNTRYSTPIFYGEQNIKSMKISDFIGTTTSVQTKTNNKVKPITEEMYSQMQYDKSLEKAMDVKSKMLIKSKRQEEKTKTDVLISTLNKISSKIYPLKRTKFANYDDDDDYTVTDDYLYVLEYFFKIYGGVQQKDQLKVSKFLLKLSKSVPKEEIIKAIDESINAN